MASVQARREKVTDEGGILVEKDTVPKMATHFETLAGKTRSDQLHAPLHGEKDVSSGTGEKDVAAGGFVGKVKDQAVVVGWGTAQYTLEKVAEATKAAAGMTSSVAGYTGEKVVAAKDKVAGAGETVVRYAGEKIAATTDAVVAAEEKAAEYAARKQVEARREVEARRASHSHEIVNIYCIPIQSNPINRRNDELSCLFYLWDCIAGGRRKRGAERGREVDGRKRGRGAEWQHSWSNWGNNSGNRANNQGISLVAESNPKER